MAAYKISGHTCDNGFFDIQPLMDFLKNFRFMLLDPKVLPDRIFVTGRYYSGLHQAFEQKGDTDIGNFRTGAAVFFFQITGTLIHITHGRAQMVSLFIKEDDALHL